MGNSTVMSDKTCVTESARQGGAGEVAGKFKDGLNTILEPFQGVWSAMSPGLPNDHPLKIAHQAPFRQAAEVSGEFCLIYSLLALTLALRWRKAEARRVSLVRVAITSCLTFPFRSRMFMRFTSRNIRLVCVDEPSSALDPEAELKLFNNLRQVREGKPMIFITHRFGHLAQYADLIL